MFKNGRQFHIPFLVNHRRYKVHHTTPHHHHGRREGVMSTSRRPVLSLQLLSICLVVPSVQTRRAATIIEEHRVFIGKTYISHNGRWLVTYIGSTEMSPRLYYQGRRRWRCWNKTDSDRSTHWYRIQITAIVSATVEGVAQTAATLEVAMVLRERGKVTRACS
ncbi:uncharacterized protein ARMOST_18873 [Armillaria ostoyae]|uniref:Uncharacterized protein n=1 Tax=Armillaria ostoyae TaxID=47428 RepID=A0A284S2Z0_ARMOS|nr:uncharacterized protein ARMOST_18873 [Armillaria ostoyae]